MGKQLGLASWSGQGQRSLTQITKPEPSDENEQLTSSLNLHSGLETGQRQRRAMLTTKLAALAWGRSPFFSDPMLFARAGVDGVSFAKVCVNEGRSPGRERNRCSSRSEPSPRHAFGLDYRFRNSPWPSSFRQTLHPRWEGCWFFCYTFLFILHGWKQG